MNIIDLIKNEKLKIISVDAACARERIYNGGRNIESIASKLDKVRDGGRRWARMIAFSGKDDNGVEWGVDVETHERIRWDTESLDLDDHSKAIMKAALGRAGKKGGEKRNKRKREGFDYAAFSAAGVAARKAKKALKEKTIYKF